MFPSRKSIQYIRETPTARFAIKKFIPKTSNRLALLLLRFTVNHYTVQKYTTTRECFGK